MWVVSSRQLFLVTGVLVEVVVGMVGGGVGVGWVVGGGVCASSSWGLDWVVGAGGGVGWVAGDVVRCTIPSIPYRSTGVGGCLLVLVFVRVLVLL